MGSFGTWMSVLSVAGIALGVSSLMVVISVMMGFDREQRLRILDQQPHVTVNLDSVETRSLDLSRYETIRKNIASKPGVRSVSLVSRDDILIRSETGVMAADLQMIESSEWERIHVNAKERIFGESADEPIPGGKKPYDVIIEESLANRLALVPGDSIHEIDLRDSDGPFGLIPSINSYRVAGVISNQNNVTEGERLPLIFKELTLNFNEESGLIKGVLFLEIKLFDPNGIIAINEEITASLHQLGLRAFKLTSWKERNSRLLQSLAIERLGMGIGLFFVVVVAALNLVTGLSLQVIRRQRELAILQTYGAMPRFVRGVFVKIGLLLGGLGILLGLLFGFGTLFWIQHSGQWIRLPDVYYDRTLPVEYMPFTYIMICIFAVFVVWLVSFLPAKKVEKQSVVYGLGRMIG